MRFRATRSSHDMIIRIYHHLFAIGRRRKATKEHGNGRGRERVAESPNTTSDVGGPNAQGTKEQGYGKTDWDDDQGPERADRRRRGQTHMLAGGFGFSRPVAGYMCLAYLPFSQFKGRVLDAAVWWITDWSNTTRFTWAYWLNRWYRSDRSRFIYVYMLHNILSILYCFIIYMHVVCLAGAANLTYWISPANLSAHSTGRQFQL